MIYTLLILLIIDSIWLGLIARNFYSGELANLNRGQPIRRLHLAIFVYMLMGLSFRYFVYPNLKSYSVREIAFYGGMTGLIIYGIYDFTNLATLNDFTLKMAIVDTIWGVSLYTITSLIRFSYLNKYPFYSLI